MMGTAVTVPWLTILGIGEDGVQGLSDAARALLRGAELVFGGARHLALAQPLIFGKTIAWPSPLSNAIPQILARRGHPTVVLASGDPFCFGIGVTLARHADKTEWLCLPALSAFALACARLGWATQETSQVSLCGRPIEALVPLLQPKRRILVLSADETTPRTLATYLVGRGFGSSRLHVLEALGGREERCRVATANAFNLMEIHPLNLTGIEVVAGRGAQVVPLACGLPDEIFEHDGQITKREVRAITLSALAPCAGELLWDIGGGAGSIAIEWMLRHPDNRAIMLEPKPERAAKAARNACQLGVMALDIVQGRAPRRWPASRRRMRSFSAGARAILQ
jgi:precorrin-6Y C5,15-methyltransferase (decarboxylating)